MEEELSACWAVNYNVNSNIKIKIHCVYSFPSIHSFLLYLLFQPMVPPLTQLLEPETRVILDFLSVASINGLLSHQDSALLSFVISSHIYYHYSSSFLIGFLSPVSTPSNLPSLPLPERMFLHANLIFFCHTLHCLNPSMAPHYLQDKIQPLPSVWGLCRI